MSGPTEFSLESVRQFMLAREGRVTNHELVKQFKAWLTHPTEKDSARQKFKEYVNTLATIKQENGEKYLVLKKRFYPNFARDDYDAPSSSPSLLDEVMAGYHQSVSRRNSGYDSVLSRQNSVGVPSDLGIPIPYSGCPSSASSTSQSRRDSYSSSSSPVVCRPTPPPPPPPPSAPPYRSPPPPPDFGLPNINNYQSSAIPPTEPPPPLPKKGSDFQEERRVPPPPPPPPTSIPPIKNSTNPVPEKDEEEKEEEEEEAPPLPNKPNLNKQLSGSVSSLNAKVTPELKTRRSVSTTEVDNKENSSPEKNEKISVKERTKTFNRMASEVELNVIKQQAVSLSGAAVKRRNSRAADRRASSIKDDDTSSISTLDHNVKQWMIKASQGDYHTMAKMLLDDPRLAKHKDFTNGYTALHWACKHGNLDMVKMLCGNYNVDVNSKSHGGYTPLHLTCQFGNQEVFELLVKAYGADPNIRDNSGKKPRQYMVATEQTSSLSLSSATFKQLKDRRRNRRQATEKNAGILRLGSLSVKVKKTTEAFNNYFHHGSEKKGFDPDRQRMPPPKFAPIKKRKSKRPSDYGRAAAAVVSAARNMDQVVSVKEVVEEEDIDSDSEYGFDSQWSH